MPAVLTTASDIRCGPAASHAGTAGAAGAAKLTEASSRVLSAEAIGELGRQERTEVRVAERLSPSRRIVDVPHEDRQQGRDDVLTLQPFDDAHGAEVVQIMLCVEEDQQAFVEARLRSSRLHPHISRIAEDGAVESVASQSAARFEAHGAGIVARRRPTLTA